MSGAQAEEKKVLKTITKKTEVIDGITYKMGRYRYGQKLAMNERAIEITVEDFNQDNPMKSKFKPRVRKDLIELLSVLYAIKSWTFRGYNDDDELITDESVEILPITEENVRDLPPSHGETLMKISGEINGLDELLRKN